jgi:hypothetical protein
MKHATRSAYLVGGRDYLGGAGRGSGRLHLLHQTEATNWR